MKRSIRRSRRWLRLRGGFIFGSHDQLVIACNTAHLFITDIESLFGHPVTSLIDTTVSRLEKLGVRRVGLLASPTTIRTRLYESALAERGIRCVLPATTELDDIEQQIRAVIAGKPASAATLRRIAARLRQTGAEKVLLGCTELSVLMAAEGASGFIDPLRLMAARLMAE